MWRSFESDSQSSSNSEEDRSSSNSSLSRSTSQSSRFEECFDEDQSHDFCKGADTAAHHCVLERHQDPEIPWDRSSVQEVYGEALRIGREGNTAFHSHEYGKAIEYYGHAMLLIESIEAKNCDGTRPYDPRLDIKITAITFTILVNTAASFIDFAAYDHCDPIDERSSRSRYEEALECTRVALGVLEQSQKQNPEGSHWHPNQSDWARLYKVKAAAYQGIGDHDKVLCNCRRVLEHSPCDQSCRKYVERCQRSYELDVHLLAERLEDLLYRESNYDHSEAVT